MESSKSSFGFYMLMVFAMIAWGGSWVSARWGHQFDPNVIAFWRGLIGAAVFVPIILLLRDSFKIPRSALLSIILAALAMAVYNLLFLWGVRDSDAGYGGVLVPTLNALFGFVIVLIAQGKFPLPLQIIGLSLGFLGGIIQILGPGFQFERLLRLDNILFLAGAIVYALITFLSARAQKSVSAFNFNFWVSAIGTLLSLPLLLYSPVFDVGQMPAEFWLDVLYLALISGGFGTTAYFFAAKKIGSAKGGSFTFLVPATALVLGALLLGERPEITSIIGGLLAIFAVLIIQSAKKKQA